MELKETNYKNEKLDEINAEKSPIEKDRKIKQPPVLFKNTQSLISKVEEMLGHKMIVYWTSGRGSVCQNDVLALYEVFKKIGKNEQLSIFIKSDGGDVEAALRIVNLIRTYSENVTALVPLNCASAATMIALGANEISMGPLSFITAIDSSIAHDLSPIDERENSRVTVSQDELQRIIRLWGENSKEHHGHPYTDLFQYVHPLVIGALDRSSSLSIKICKEILSYHIDDDNECDRISNHLNSDYPSHGYPITAREATRIGLNISNLNEDINNVLLELNKHYSEMAQKALTDYDENNYHDNEISNILETKGTQVFYQNDKDWNYIPNERRWQVLNNESSWRKIEDIDGKVINDTFYIA
ncbi:MAG: ATP-dependent Clp protease proteolytic subunit [Clostridiaceae bacterium]|nr:ATP-dependent Clp protease proteolytic subunit [Clostridiaceae bacterium]